MNLFKTNGPNSIMHAALAPRSIMDEPLPTEGFFRIPANDRWIIARRHVGDTYELTTYSEKGTPLGKCDIDTITTWAPIAWYQPPEPPTDGRLFKIRISDNWFVGRYHNGSIQLFLKNVTADDTVHDLIDMSAIRDWLPL